MEAFNADGSPSRLAQAMPLLLVALDTLSEESRQIVVAGHADREDTRALLRTIHRRLRPGEVVLLADGGEGQLELAKRLPFIEGVARLLEDK